MSHDLKQEVARLWNLRKMLVILVSALGVINILICHFMMDIKKKDDSLRPQAVLKT